MAIIDESYFVSEISVAQRSDEAVMEDLDFKIEKYERDFLIKFFGVKMYKEFIEGIKDPIINPKWSRLLEEGFFNNDNSFWIGLTNDNKQSVIANYVYYYYTRDLFLQSTGSGNVIPVNENSITVNPVYKQVRAWNEMIDWICIFHKLIRENIIDYPSYTWRNFSDPCCKTICSCSCSCGNRFPFTKINSLGI